MCNRVQSLLPVPLEEPARRSMFDCHLVLLQKDGSEGKSLSLKPFLGNESANNNVFIGNDPQAHIHIKSSKIASKHAAVSVQPALSSSSRHFQVLLKCFQENIRVNGASVSELVEVRRESYFSNKSGEDNLMFKMVAIHDMDVISIAGRHLLLKCSGSDQLGEEDERSHVSMSDHEDEMFETLSHSSITSKHSFSSQRSTLSNNSTGSCSFSAADALPQGDENKVYGYLQLLNRDGSQGTPFAVRKKVIFGSERPANIRVKSVALDPQHAMVTVDRQNFTCSLVHIASHHPPRINGRKLKGGFVKLHHNDIISIAGREFLFKATSLKRTDNENAATCEDSQEGVYDKQRHRVGKRRRRFGDEIHENVKNEVHVQQNLMVRSFEHHEGNHDGHGNGKSKGKSVSSLLRVDTSRHHRSDSQAPTSLSSLSSQSADEAETPKVQQVFAPEGESVLSAEEVRNPSPKKSPQETRHVQFRPNSVALSDGEDEEEAFFDIIAEADRLLLNKEDELAFNVDYNRLVRSDQLDDDVAFDFSTLDLPKFPVPDDDNDMITLRRTEAQVDEEEFPNVSLPTDLINSEVDDELNLPTLDLPEIPTSNAIASNAAETPLEELESTREVLPPLFEDETCISEAESNTSDGHRVPEAANISYIRRIIDAVLSFETLFQRQSPLISHQTESTSDLDVDVELGETSNETELGVTSLRGEERTPNGHWLLFTFRYLSRRWRGFF